MTLFDLKDKVAVITGSSRGMGRAMAEQLLQRGQALQHLRMRRLALEFAEGSTEHGRAHLGTASAAAASRIPAPTIT